MLASLVSQASTVALLLSRVVSRCERSAGGSEDRLLIWANKAEDRQDITTRKAARVTCNQSMNAETIQQRLKQAGEISPPGLRAETQNTKLELKQLQLCYHSVIIA